MTKPIPVSDQEFEQQVVQADQPTLVDFWAEWCGPCKMIAPVLDELADEYDGQVQFVKLNVDENPSTAMKFGVRGIPTLLLFKGGQPVDQIVGAVPKAAVKKKLEQVLAN